MYINTNIDGLVKISLNNLMEKGLEVKEKVIYIRPMQ